MFGGTTWATVVIASGLVNLGVLGAVLRRRSNPGAHLFALLQGLAILYTFGYAAQILATTLPGKLFWLKMQYLGPGFLPVAALVFALEYTGRSDWITLRTVSILLVLPVTSVVAVWFAPDNGLLISDVHLVSVGGHPDLEYSLGPLGQLFWLYQYVLYAVSILMFLGLGVRSRAYRTQGALLCLAFLIPVLVAGTAAVLPAVVVDPTPPALLLTGVLVTWGVYRSQFLDVVPVDRDRILDRIRGAVIVLDTQWRVVDTNRAGRALFGDDFSVGTAADTLFDAVGFERSVATLQDGQTITRTDGREYRYEVSREEIETWNGDLRGVVLTLYDVTERWQAERRLQESNEQLAVLSRVLRHDIRNDAAVILGWSDLLAESVDAEDRQNLNRIDTSAQHIVELTETARGLAEAFVNDADMEVTPVALESVLADAIATARSQYPDATFHEPSSYPGLSVTANELLPSVFRNLLNNAVQHNDGRPEITVSIDRLDGSVRVAIEDNGPGIPDDVRERLFERGRKGTDSTGTGLGLYLVRHLVETYGGSITAEDNDPRGTRMLVTLPVSDEPGLPDDHPSDTIRSTDRSAAYPGIESPDDEGESGTRDRR